MANSNPFEVLALDPTATEEQVVKQAGRLRQRCTDEATLTAIRQAVQALTGRAEDRMLQALLAHPQPTYAWPALDRFAGAHRRAPAPTSPAAPSPPLDLSEFASLLRAQLAQELELAPQPFEPLPTGEDAADIRRQAAEALWQSLVCDPRA
jgi:hypothetical protein